MAKTIEIQGQTFTPEMQVRIATRIKAAGIETTTILAREDADGETPLYFLQGDSWEYSGLAIVGNRICSK